MAAQEETGIFRMLLFVTVFGGFLIPNYVI